MAKTIAICTGIDMSGRQKQVTRLGSYAAEAQANTWKTFTTCCVWKDGSGYVSVQRDGVTLHTFRFGVEDVPDAGS